MKRPNRENYDTGEYGEIKYIDRLERYCSYLENKNQSLQLQQTGVMVSAFDNNNIEELASELFSDLPYQISTTTAKKKSVELVKLLTQSNLKHLP